MGNSCSTRKSYVGLKLKKHDIALEFHIPAADDRLKHSTPEEETESFARILVLHAAFKASLQPALRYSDGYYRRCVAEVKAVRIFFPDPLPDSTMACFAAWLAFVCAMDDQLEQMTPEQGETAMLDCIEAVQGRPPLAKPEGVEGDVTVPSMARVLHQHCSQLLAEDSVDAFFEAACAVFSAHIGEIRFLSSSQATRDLETYMAIRRRTIALDPFFEVLKHDHLDKAERASPAWERLQHHVCLAAGLQNDLVGLEKDVEAGERMNAVLVLLDGLATAGGEDHDAALAEAVGLVNEEHNSNAALAGLCFHELTDAEGVSSQAKWVARCVVQLCQTHLRWCSSAKRYRLVE
ncbi:hypothetical protein RB595_006897 [Gaeumannomyces hyphopodioides]